MISPTLDGIIAQIGPLDKKAMAQARRRQDTLTKPLGSLGRLEEVSIHLAGIFSDPMPRIRAKVIVLAAGDHGVVREGVSAYPQEVTAQMVLNFLRGGAAINVLAKQMNARVLVVDAGVAADLPPDPRLLSRKIGKGTGNMAIGPAMTREQAIRCLEEGARLAMEQARQGADLLATGDMGIGNTTASSAITSVFTGMSPEKVAGRGAGLDAEGVARKAAVVARALAVNRPSPGDAVGVLQKVGGFEIGFLAGVYLGAAAARRPVLMDGFISGAAALIACGVCPAARGYIIATHRSVEPGHRAVMAHLRLRPLLDLRMRLGEGSGAALAMPIVESAARCLTEMATFASAGVSEKGE